MGGSGGRIWIWRLFGRIKGVCRGMGEREGERERRGGGCGKSGDLEKEGRGKGVTRMLIIMMAFIFLLCSPYFKAYTAIQAVL